MFFTVKIQKKKSDKKCSSVKETLKDISVDWMVINSRMRRKEPALQHKKQAFCPPPRVFYVLCHSIPFLLHFDICSRRQIINFCCVRIFVYKLFVHCAADG